MGTPDLSFLREMLRLRAASEQRVHAIAVAVDGQWRRLSFEKLETRRLLLEDVADLSERIAKFYRDCGVAANPIELMSSDVSPALLELEEIDEQLRFLKEQFRILKAVEARAEASGPPRHRKDYSTKPQCEAIASSHGDRCLNNVETGSSTCAAHKAHKTKAVVAPTIVDAKLGFVVKRWKDYGPADIPDAEPPVPITYVSDVPSFSEHMMRRQVDKYAAAIIARNYKTLRVRRVSRRYEGYELNP